MFFSAALAISGPLSLGRAEAGAALAGAIVTGSMVLARQRFDAVGPFLQTGHPLTAASVAVALLLPFWIAGQRLRTRWNDYPALFDATWRIVLRYLVGVLFTLLVWAMIFLGVECRISGSVGATVSTHCPSPEADRMLRDAEADL